MTRASVQTDEGADLVWASRCQGGADGQGRQGSADGRADGWCQWQYRWTEQTALQTEVHIGRTSGKVNVTNRTFCSDWEGM